MGTGFDEAIPQSHHGATDIPLASPQRNRFTLLGIMMAAGWDNYKNEWWHYQMFNSRDYPLIDQAQLPTPDDVFFFFIFGPHVRAAANPPPACSAGGGGAASGLGLAQQHQQRDGAERHPHHQHKIVDISDARGSGA